MSTVYGDGQAELATVLREALAGRQEPYTEGVRVNTRIPSGNEPYGASAPLVVVRQDGNGRDQGGVRQIVGYRVLAWNVDEDSTYDLIQLCHALILEHSGGSVVTKVLAELTPDVTADPDTQEPMGSFTVRGKLRPITLSTQ